MDQRSPTEKKERMANKIKDQQLGPNGLKHLCSIFMFNGVYVNISCLYILCLYVFNMIVCIIKK